MKKKKRLSGMGFEPPPTSGMGHIERPYDWQNQKVRDLHPYPHQWIPDLDSGALDCSATLDKTELAIYTIW